MAISEHPFRSNSQLLSSFCKLCFLLMAFNQLLKRLELYHLPFQHWVKFALATLPLTLYSIILSFLLLIFLNKSSVQAKAFTFPFQFRSSSFQLLIILPNATCIIPILRILIVLLWCSIDPWFLYVDYSLFTYVFNVPTEYFQCVFES